MRPKEPISMVINKGKKHLTKAEINERQESEIKPCTDDIRPPSYLTAKQKKRFFELVDQLKRLEIIGETDVETLAHYITAEELYQQATKDIRSAQKCKPDSGNLDEMSEWAKMMDKLDRRQDRYFRQAHTAASSLGLTVTSRCRIAVPKAPEVPKENKFNKFRKVAGNE